MTIKYRSGDQGDWLADSDATGLGNPNPEIRANQEQREEADINVILKDFGITGQLRQRVPPPPLESFVDVLDYHQAQLAIVAAQASFMSLPAEVRAQFDNDAGRFVDYASDKANQAQMALWGMAEPPPPAETAPVASEKATA